MNIVLVEPEIHWNTGNIGRTCVATGTTLHLVGKLGFSLEAKEIRRAGLDYWEKLDLRLHADWKSFLDSAGRQAPLLFFSTKAAALFWDAPYVPENYLIFGKETGGLPPEIHRDFADRMYRVPIGRDVRSLNLSTAAGVVLYEALRQAKITPSPGS